jgi:hypothetical protein
MTNPFQFPLSNQAPFPLQLLDTKTKTEITKMLRVTEKQRPGCVKRELSASQKVSKKYLKAHMKRLHKKEYRKLREMVPAVAHKEKVSKVN